MDTAIHGQCTCFVLGIWYIGRMSPATLTKPLVNLVTKSQLARLLATENISIQHSPSARTACFDTNTRKLILPIWNKASESVYDMLVAHEVGHALITPGEAVYMPVCTRVSPRDPSKFFRYLNIVEDIRVDAHIKNTYPGVRRSYFNAWKELLVENFFELDGSIADQSFGDRVNIFSKAGQYGFIDVSFSAAEQVIVDDAMRVSTFEEVCAVAERIYNFNKNNQQDPQQGEGNEPQRGESDSQPDEADGEAEDDSQSDDGEGQEEGEGEGKPTDKPCKGKNPSDGQTREEGKKGKPKQVDDSSDSDGDANGGGSNGKTGSGSDQNQGDQGEAPDLKTDTAADNGFNKLQDNKYEQYRYLDMPRINLDAVIFDSKRIASDLGAYRDSADFSGDKIFAAIQERNKSFVLNLVKQFEQKMAADTIRRTKYARCGALDMRRISNYKFSDDLFLKNATVQAGKNHGMVFIMDWSGSMSNCLLPTVEQLIALCLFCRRMNIPFEVFAFTNASPVKQRKTTSNTDGSYDGSYNSYMDQCNQQVSDSAAISPSYSVKVAPVVQGSYNRDELIVGNFLKIESIGMMNFLSSKMNTNEFKNSAELLCQLARNCDASGSDLYNIGSYVCSSCEDIYRLSGTPLTEAAYIAIDIVNLFKVQHRLDIVNTVFLTDGYPTSSLVGGNRYNETVIVNLPNRKQVAINSEDIRQKYGSMQHSIELLGIIGIFRELTGSNAISIHLTDKRQYSYLAQAYSLDNTAKKDLLLQEWKDNNFFSVKELGFTESFVIDAKTEIVDPDDIFEGLKEGASDAVIARTFIKGNQKQATSRVLLNRFSDLIAKKILA